MSSAFSTQQIALSALQNALVVRELTLEVVDGPDTGARFGPFEPPVRIGSALGNQAVLGDGTVSRFHASLERTPDGLVVIDQGSKNGTFLGPHRVREAFVSDGAVLRLGQTSLKVLVSGKARPVEISGKNRFGNLLGDSPNMRTLFATLARLAPAEAPVLIEGETGTGKELVARALHSESPRAERPFVVVDCGAVAPQLVESELFGHTKGAFTGADAPRTGAFELADGGTLFLDEIGELPLSLQPKFLRALETSTIKPLGAAREKSVAVRVVAATHRDLRQMVNQQSFREDLYFRLAVCPVRVPPLRDRLGDIPILARHFLQRALSGTGVPPEEVPAPTPETIALLSTQSWSGNVREFRNSIERAVILGDPERVATGDLTSSLREVGSIERRSESPPVAMLEAKRLFEREYLIKLLGRHRDDLAAAAAEAKIHPKSLERLIRRHGLRRGA